ncbi:hypothetical protein [Sinimarinibacterium sp. NLF-5-8]|uniref:hypothetical protein n=1 Tax=Sinimarinibacterium sp. NLF-5-8 TaxID=2698684 RepID=UPI00137C2B84|nr:hypothetical protein [Sinimarinibacterium sp. NLF-5-8]QHS09132.1 hypothetical protein GT972_02495 [Sinimarinibacterium sp. NLF-5-8]
MFKPYYISDANALSKLGKRKRIIVSSSLVPAQLWRADSMDDDNSAAMEDSYQVQPLRSLKASLSLGAPGDGVRCFLPKSFLYEIHASKAIPTLAIDIWLSWGKRRKNENLLILGGGFDAPGLPTAVDIMLFESGVLKRLTQVSIQSRESALYADELSDLLTRELRADSHSDLKVYVAQTLLPDAGLPAHTIQPIPTAFIHRPRLSPIRYGFMHLTWPDLIVPAAIVGIGAAAGALQIAQASTAFDHARQTFRTQVASVGDAYAAGEGVLTVLSAQRSFMDAASPLRSRIADLERLFAGIASVEGVALTGVALPSATTGFDALVQGAPLINKEADYFMQVAIRDDQEGGVLAKSEPILKQISQAIGGRLELNNLQPQARTVDTVRVQGLNLEGRFGPRDEDNPAQEDKEILQPAEPDDADAGVSLDSDAG